MDQAQLVPVNCVFFNPVNPHDGAFKIDIPLQNFTHQCMDCRRLFIDPLLNEYKFVARETGITFWQPKQDLSLSIVRERGWTRSINNFDEVFTKIPFPRPFEQALEGTINNMGVVHLIVTAKGFYNTGRLAVCEPLEIQRYLRIVATAGQSLPGVTGFTNEVITIAPPIEIFHPVFAQFARDANDARSKPPPEILNRVEGFMVFNSTIQESDYTATQWFRDELIGILGYKITEDWSTETPFTNGIITCETDSGEDAPLLIMERKLTLGDGGGDPSIQVGHSMRHAWLQTDLAGVRNQCCCPTFLLAGGGPWLCVLGAVFTDKFIVQRLTDMMWIGLSSTAGRIICVSRLARVLVALRKGLDSLREFYEKLPTYDDTSYEPPLCRQRFFPYPTYFLEDGSKVYFDYMQALEDDPRCVTYLARTRDVDHPDIVVKFVQRYGKDVHEFLAAKGFAPRLRYSGQLDTPDENGSDLCPTEVPQGPVLASPMMMVVMNFVERQAGPLPGSARKQVQQILMALHCEGYVFGDLRDSNILFDSDGKAKLIDFDRAGQYDMSVQDNGLPSDLQASTMYKTGDIEQVVKTEFVCYPFGMSKKVDWADGMRDLEPIRPRHDWDMLGRLWGCGDRDGKAAT